MKITKNGLKIPEDSDVADLTVFVGENMEIVDDLAGKMAPYDDSGIKEEIGNITDLATNTKTNLVGAINELADYDVVTVTENDYTFQVTKSNVCVVATNDDAEINSCEIWSPKNGKIITIYNSKWEGSTKDVTICNVFDGDVTIALGEHRTFQCSNGHLNDLGKIAAQSIDYGTEDYVRISKPAKRYFVQVPVGNASIRDLRISNLDLAKDKKYYVNACIYAENTGHVDLFLPANFIDIVGCSITDGVYNGTMSGDLNFNSGGSDIYMHITGVFEPEMALQYVAGKLDVLYATADAVNIHHRTIHGIFGMFDAFSIQLNTGYGFLEGSYIEITTV